MTTEVQVFDQTDLAREVCSKIEERFRDNQELFDRMDEDLDLYTLKKWAPEETEESSISPEDAYTTNAPRVLARKVMAFIAP